MMGRLSYFTLREIQIQSMIIFRRNFLPVFAVVEYLEVVDLVYCYVHSMTSMVDSWLIEISARKETDMIIVDV